MTSPLNSTQDQLLPVSTLDLRSPSRTLHYCKSPPFYPIRWRWHHSRQRRYNNYQSNLLTDEPLEDPILRNPAPAQFIGFSEHVDTAPLLSIVEPIANRDDIAILPSDSLLNQTKSTLVSFLTPALRITLISKTPFPRYPVRHHCPNYTFQRSHPYSTKFHLFNVTSRNFISLYVSMFDFDWNFYVSRSKI